MVLSLMASSSQLYLQKALLDVQLYSEFALNDPTFWEKIRWG